MAEEPTEPTFPAEVWQNYDPRQTPLDEELLREWTADGIRYREVFFNGDICRDSRVRIYGIYACPQGGRNLPAVLHIHGGGQTVNERWLAFWAGRGYAALSINWGGEWPNREKFTRYPPTMPQGNHKQSSHTVGAPTMWDNSWMIWTRVCRRALTYLESQPEVDPSRLGAFGISMGGSLIWNLAIDDRLKVGCAIYGAGWDSYRHDEPKFAVPAVRRDLPEAIRTWRRLGAPEAYAPLVRFPMLFLNSTNDQHGDMDRVLDSLALIPAGVPRRQGITPRFRHHIGREFAGDLPAWIDHFLKGGPPLHETPELKLAVGNDGVPVLEVVPDRSQPVQGIDVWYALEHPYAVSRHWRLASSGSATCVRVPVMHADRVLFAFANVRYADAVTLTSQFIAENPAARGAARATLEPSTDLYGPNQRDGGFVPSSYGTDPEPDSLAKTDYFPKAVTRAGRDGLVPDPRSGMATLKPADPQFRAPADAKWLDLLVTGPAGCPIEVALHAKFYRPGHRVYRTRIAVPPGEGWQSVSLPVDQFVETPPATAGSPPNLLETFADIEMLEVRPPDDAQGAWLELTPAFGEFRWRR